MTDNSPLRWHSHPHPLLRNSGDTVDGHQSRVVTMCISLAAHIGHPLHDSDMIHAALHHDDAERVLGDMPGPAKDHFPALRAAYVMAEKIVLAEMGLTWNLTRKESAMLDLCDKLDAWLWARKCGVTGTEWDRALVSLHFMAKDLDATDWLDNATK